MIRVSRGHPTDFLNDLEHMHDCQRSVKAMTAASGPYYLGGSATTPQLINERTLTGYDIPDNSKNLVKYNEEQRKQYRLDKLIEYRYRASMYMLSVMKKITGNGCIMAAHQFG